MTDLHALEIRKLHSNAVLCVGCAIHGDPGKHDVEIAKIALSRHLAKHVEQLEHLWGPPGGGGEVRFVSDSTLPSGSLVFTVNPQAGAKGLPGSQGGPGGKNHFAFSVKDADQWDDANARLIAAAPDLLEACESLLSVAEDCRERWSRGHAGRVDQARAAIKKARGGV